MLRLRTFGGLAVDQAAFLDGAAARRRPLALLALLAVAGSRGVSRDKLIAYFWPESDVERARNSLSQALSSLRRELGVEELVLGAADLRLNRDLITSDVQEFLERLEADDLERAAALNGGPFLDGVFLKGAPEFERWVERERRRLHDLHVQALEKLAERATARGDHAASVRWWREAAHAEPLNARATQRLMEALGATGDSAGALKLFQVHQSLVRAELGMEPEPALVALAERLRYGNGTRGGPDAMVRHPPDASSPTEGPATWAPTVATPPFSLARRRPLAVAGVALVVMLGAPAAWRWERGPAAARSRIVVVPFENRTRDSSLADIGVLLADWLTDGLVKRAGAPVVPATTVRELMSREAASSTPRLFARRTGATMLVAGHYARVGDSLEFRAEVLNVADGGLLASIGPLRGLPSQTAVFDSVLERLTVVHELMREGRARRFSGWSQPRSMSALREYNAATNEHYVHQDWLGAIPLYERAHTRDPAWIAPLTQISSSYANLGRGREADSVLDIARGLLTSAQPGDRARIDWSAASHRGDFEAQYQAGRVLLALDPIGEAYHAFVGAERTARFHEARRLAERRDTTYFDREWMAWDSRHLHVLHALERYDDELRVARGLLTRRGLTIYTAFLAVPSMAALGRTREVDSLVAQVWGMLPDGAALTPASVANAAGWEYLAHGAERLARPVLQRSLDWYLARPSAEQSKWARGRAEALFVGGRFVEARALYDSLVRAAPQQPALLGMLGMSAVMLGDSALTRDVDTRLSAMDGHRGVPSLWRGRMAAVRGDCASAVGLLRSALPMGPARANPEAETAHHRWAAFGKARTCKGLAQALAPRD